MTHAAEPRHWARAWAFLGVLSGWAVPSVSAAVEPVQAATPEERKALAEKAQQLDDKLEKADREGRVDDALGLAREALRIREQLYPASTHPDGHPDLATSINNLGALLRDRGDCAGAQPLYERALAMREKLYPTERFP